MNALRDRCAIVGTGKSRLGQVGANSLALLDEAIKNALTEAGLTNKDVDGVVEEQAATVVRAQATPRAGTTPNTDRDLERSILISFCGKHALRHQRRHQGVKGWDLFVFRPPMPEPPHIGRRERAGSQFRPNRNAGE